MTWHVFRQFLQGYAVLILIVLLIVALSLLSDSFLTFRNLLNILNQNSPLAIMASVNASFRRCYGPGFIAR